MFELGLEEHKWRHVKQKKSHGHGPGGIRVPHVFEDGVGLCSLDSG